MKILRKFKGSESGQILVPALIMLLLTGIMAVPLLGFMGTGLKAVTLYHDNNDRLYAADAGIQYGILKVATDLDLRVTSATKTYPAITVNNKSTVVTVEYWSVLDGIIGDREGPHSTWLELTTTGIATMDGEYIIDLVYDGNPGNKKIEAMGVWMPSPFDYLAGSAALYPDNITTKPPETRPVNGGTSIEWDRLAFELQGHPHCSQTFKFTPSEKIPKGACAWVKGQSMDIGYSYDHNIYFYAITSVASDISGTKQDTIVAHVGNDTSTSEVSILTYEINP